MSKLASSLGSHESQSIAPEIAQGPISHIMISGALDHHHYSEQSLVLFYLSGIHPDEPFVPEVYEKAHADYVAPADDLGSIIEGIVSSTGISYLDAIQLHLSRHPELDMDQIAIQIQVNSELFEKLEAEARSARNLKPITELSTPKNPPHPRRPLLVKVCPHCGFIGGGGMMRRWHFDNCRNRIEDHRIAADAHTDASVQFRKPGNPKPIEPPPEPPKPIPSNGVICTQCGTIGSGAIMRRWHFDRCRKRPAPSSDTRLTEAIASKPEPRNFKVQIWCGTGVRRKGHLVIG